MQYLTILFLLINILLLFVFLIRSKIVSLMSTSLKLGFFIFMFLGISAVLIPGLYETLSDLLLKSVGVHESIQEWDGNFFVSTISGTTNDIIGGLQDLLGDEEFAEESIVSEAFFEENLYPVLITTVALILRISVGIISLLGMIGAIYLGFATTSISDTQSLRRRHDALEARVLELEARLNN